VTEPTVPDGDAILALAAALLPEAATRSVGWSRELCRHVDHSGRDCGAYHGVWPYILWFGLATPPQRQRRFYGAALGEAVRTGARRILISGAADYNLPATALWACRAAAIDPRLTVLDICETPLRLSSWFAERAGFAVETVVGDIITYRPAQRFDAVVVHSFLGNFVPEARGQLVRSWWDVLMPGGRVILVNRVRPDAPDVIRFSPAQTESLRARVLAEAQQRAASLAFPPDRVAALIDGFAAHNVVFPLRAPESLAALFADNGFHVHTLAVDSADPVGPLVSPGPTLTGGVDYIELVAIKR
jgi:SAM-dependent methyltransferase